MSKYILRLDDACQYRNLSNWDRIETLCDKYNVKPLVGIIPDCKDDYLLKLDKDNDFWNKTVVRWINKEWEIAMHGYNHVFTTNVAGINPVNARSEFAGVLFESQREMIKKGVSIFRKNGLDPLVFFAPAHTYDENTLKALKLETNIKIISDTPASNIYEMHGFTFVPQQSGHATRLPFRVITFCYHPNNMNEQDFNLLEDFMRKNKFVTFPLEQSKRKKSLYDRLINKIYFYRKRGNR